MSITHRLLAASATAALLITPGVALAGGPPAGKGHRPAATNAFVAPAADGTTSTTDSTSTPVDPPVVTPPATTPAPKGNAYGVRCRGKSKKHVKGQKGTEFSRCVKALHKKGGDGGTTPTDPTPPTTDPVPPTDGNSSPVTDGTAPAA